MPQTPPSGQRVSTATLDAWLATELSSGVVTPEHLQLARELVSLQPGLSALDSGLLTRLVIAVLAAMDAGGTRQGLTGDEGRAIFGTTWKDQGGEATVVAELRQRLDALATPEQAGALIGTPSRHRPLVREGEFIYLHRTYWREVGLCEALAERMQRDVRLGSARDVEVAFGEILSTPTMAQRHTGRRGRSKDGLSAEQQYAVLAAAHAPLCIVSGGPGTGKTAILLSILRMALMLGMAPSRIALAAPTGKAAKRVGTALAAQREGGNVPPLERQLLRKVPAPKTLHRLLAYSDARGFGHDAIHPVPYDLIVVDEASMLDLGLAAHLLRAIPPGARLLLLGDADQLPPVGHGAVFRDLVPEVATYNASFADLVQGELGTTGHPLPPGDGLASCAVRLTKSFRMRAEDPAGRAILGVSLRVRDGDVGVLTESSPEHLVVARRANAASVTFCGVELLSNSSSHASRPAPSQSQLDGALGRWTHESLEAAQREVFHTHFDYHDGAFPTAEAAMIKEALARHEQAKILCVTRTGPRGTEAINTRTRALLAASIGVYDLPIFGPGTPIIVRRNDYRRGLFNGDTGIVLQVRLDHARESQPMAVFSRDEEGLVVFDVQALSTLIEPAYALTVHKSQGSEYDRVLFVLPPRDMPVLSRELIYTALTRSRQGVLIVGDEHVMGAGIMRGQRRHTGIAQRIGACLRVEERADNGEESEDILAPPG